MLQPKVNTWVYLLLLTYCGWSFALPSDKEQVVDVVADSADLNQQLHRGTYIGNVKFVQGTTNLHAAHAITKGNTKNQLVFALAKGKPNKQVHYWTDAGPNKPPIHAYADVIRYYPLRHMIELEGNARVLQGKNSMSAAKITYDTVNEHVVTQSQGKMRTTITLYPEKKTQ